MSESETECASTPLEPSPDERRRDLLKEALALAGVIGVSTLSETQAAMVETRKCPPDWRFRQRGGQSGGGTSSQGQSNSSPR